MSSPDLQTASATGTQLLVSLPPLLAAADGSFEAMLANLHAAFAGMNVVIATPDTLPPGIDGDAFKVATYTPPAQSTASWTLTAADFLNSHELSVAHNAGVVLMLGSEAQSLKPEGLRALANVLLAGQGDLAVPHYVLPPRRGLVNSAILYPISRALFGAIPRFPLAIDLCMSSRMAERLAATAQRFTAANQPDALLWPVAEASVAGYAVAQADVGTRALPQPAAPDLNTLLAEVAGSLFADVDAKAAFWQRARTAQPPRSNGSGVLPATSPTEEVQPMLEAFRLAYGNLSEIWSLVLPPQSLFGLKRLSVMTADNFSMPENLWARIVYDFLLAYRLRTINRGHLLGALTPLYLAWVASHILKTSAGKDPESLIETQAAAFETDKPYLVSRWRWPDRFNP